MPEQEDRELARLFADLRRSDAAAAPPFRTLLERPRERRGEPARIRRLAAVALLAAAIPLGVFLIRTALRRIPERATSSLAQWRSPTAFLLRIPGSDLLDRAPAMLEPPPDYREFDGSTPGRARPTVRVMPEPGSNQKGERS